jgi:dipeptidyl aminopeptidase/acylaminoacyl peptidase
MTPPDIRRQVVLEELDLSIDGRLAVVVRRSVQGNGYVSHLYAVPLDKRGVGTARRLTEGAVRDTSPRLCPDGASLAFLRRDPLDDDASTELAVMTLRTGAIRVYRSARHGAITELAWSPDGQRLAYVAEVDPPRFLVGRVPPAGATAKHKQATQAAPLARRIARSDWRSDGVGVNDRHTHLFVVEGAGARARPRQVTRGDYSVQDLAWHPDGRVLAFSSDRGAGADIRPRRTIWAIDVDAAAADDGVEPREVMAPGGYADHPAYSPDGRWLAAIGILEASTFIDTSMGVLIGPSDGSQPTRALAPDLDRPIGNWVQADLTGWMEDGREGPCWLSDETIVAIVTDRGRSHPRAFTLDPATGSPVEPPRSIPRAAEGPWSEAVTHSLAVSRNGKIAVLGTLGTRALEVMTLDADPDGPPRWTTRTTIGSAWQRPLEAPVMRRIEVPGIGGAIEAWIASPPGAPDRPLPTIVDIHGGPFWSWGPSPCIEVSLLVGRGYRVVLPNIRGSASYGQDWIRPHIGDWGGVDAADVHTTLDRVISLGLADPNRLGALGCSYGGFLVNWLVGTSDRFAAAVSENGVSNQISTWANSVGGPEYNRQHGLGDPLTAVGFERSWRQSPLRNVANVRTPLLMLQAEDDLICVPQDNEQFFIALRHLGRPVEYVLYPDESHNYQATGRPDRRIDRMTRMLDWFDRHLVASA